MGEHRLIAGKDTPYEEDIRVPMVMRGPGVPAGERFKALVGNLDLAPTLAEIAGADVPDLVDRRFFLPLLQDPERPWRGAFLIKRRRLEEQLVRQSKFSGLTPGELDQAAVFNGLRTRDLVFIEYGSGERELYYLAQDAHQLANLADETDAVLVSALSERVVELSECVGARCRGLENLPLMAGEPSQVDALSMI
jgi:N-acetylglucosamine-6-sulfatase